MAKDPVCGREVDERQAAAVVQYRLATYYFCSESCHKIFSAHVSRCGFEGDTPEPERAERQSDPACAT